MTAEHPMKLALLDDYHGVALQMADWARLAGRVEIVSFDAPITDAGEFVRRLARFDAILAMRERTPFPRSILQQLPKLRLLITTGMWNASIDSAAAAELGIQVCGTRDVGHLTAELTLGLILALARQTPHEERALREGRWHVRLGHSVRGKTLGLLGLGNLGKQVAGFGRTLGMETIAWSQNLTAAAAAEAGCRRVERNELFRAADYLTIHVRLSERTRGLVGAQELSAMKPSAYLINTSRGPIVDERALFEALSDKRIAGAALDVYAKEPLPLEDPIRGLDNVILLPHLGYVSEENYRLMYGDGLEAVEGFLAGKPLRALNAPVSRTPPRL
jgi:phosphoglycerate dehydrogenase-like enzyme